MLKLTMEQLEAAIYAANQVDDLTALRPKACDTTIRFGGKVKDDPFAGELTDIVVPAAIIADQIDAKLAAAKQVLVDLGIDFQP